MGAFPPARGSSTTTPSTWELSTDVATKIPVKESGVYHLFVRSIGTPPVPSTSRIGGKEDSGTYGQGKLAWQRGGDFALKGGGGG